MAAVAAATTTAAAAFAPCFGKGMLCGYLEAHGTEVDRCRTRLGEEILGHAESDTLDLLGLVVSACLIEGHGEHGAAASAGGNKDAYGFFRIGIAGKEREEFFFCCICDRDHTGFLLSFFCRFRVMHAWGIPAALHGLDAGLGRLLLPR